LVAGEAGQINFPAPLYATLNHGVWSRSESRCGTLIQCREIKHHQSLVTTDSPQSLKPRQGPYVYRTDLSEAFIVESRLCHHLQLLLVSR
jgi:hypothetical protein